MATSDRNIGGIYDILREQIGPALTGIPGGLIINGVAHLVSSTKPTTRLNLSPLVIGDRWWDTTNRIDWSWDGTYWCTQPYYAGLGGVVGATNAFFQSIPVTYLVNNDASPNSNIKINYIKVRTNTSGGAVDGTNFWTIQAQWQSTVGSNTNLGSAYVYNNPAANGQYQVLLADSVIAAANLSTVFLNVTKTLAPGNLVSQHQISYSFIAS
jgi:hypothetical protein